MAHRELPEGIAPDILDIIAKALMIRLGGSVELTNEEMREAGGTQAEFGMNNRGDLLFRIERQ